MIIFIHHRPVELENSTNINLINYSRLFFSLLLPSEILGKKQNLYIALCVIPTYYITLA